MISCIFYNKNDNTNEKIKKIVALYNEICVIGSAKDEIAVYTERANKNLECIKNENAGILLEKFSDMLLNRSY